MHYHAYIKTQEISKLVCWCVKMELLIYWILRALWVASSCSSISAVWDNYKSSGTVLSDVIYKVLMTEACLTDGDCNEYNFFYIYRQFVILSNICRSYSLNFNEEYGLVRRSSGCRETGLWCSSRNAF